MTGHSCDYYVQRAEQCRSFAAVEKDTNVRERLLAFAANYDALAEDLQLSEKAPDDEDDRKQVLTRPGSNGIAQASRSAFFGGVRAHPPSATQLTRATHSALPAVGEAGHG